MLAVTRKGFFAIIWIERMIASENPRFFAGFRFSEFLLCVPQNRES